MKLIYIKDFEFFGGTYDNYHVARYGSFIWSDKRRVDNDTHIIIYQGVDDIVFIEIYNKDWSNNFIIEEMKYSTIPPSRHLHKVIERHNQIVKSKSRNKTINTILK